MPSSSQELRPPRNPGRFILSLPKVAPEEVFSNEAAAEYSKVVGREVRGDEVQLVAEEVHAANLIMRRSHRVYGVTDPFPRNLA